MLDMKQRPNSEGQIHDGDTNSDSRELKAQRLKR